MSTVIIIRGPAGSGKSTISALLNKKITNCVHLDIDKFKHLISSESSPQRSKIAHKVGTVFIKELVENNFNVIVEEIFRKDYFKQVLDMLKELDCKVITVFLETRLEDAIARDANRNKTKGQQVITNLFNEITYENEMLKLDTKSLSPETCVERIYQTYQSI